jgi:Ala-tRNA(Pro) deacylase
MAVVSEPEKVYDALDTMGIQYEKYEHPPVFTSEEAAEHWGPIAATQVKNLFLRNKKATVSIWSSSRSPNRRTCAICEEDRRRSLQFWVGERLMARWRHPRLRLPFGLLHPGSKEVRVIVDQDLRSAEKLIFHPNLNTASVTISVADLERFLATRPNVVRWMKL